MRMHFFEKMYCYSIISTDTIRQALVKFKELNTCTLYVVDHEESVIGELFINDLIDTFVRNESIDQPITPYIKKTAIVFLNEDSLKDIDIEKQINLHEQMLTGIIRKGELININKKCDIFETLSGEYYSMYDKLQFIIEGVPSGILAINDQGIIIILNNAAEKIFNIKKDNMLGKHIRTLDSTMALYKVIETGEQQINVKHTINGSVIISNRAPIIKNGKIIGAVAVFQDISETEKLNHELRITKSSLEEIESIIESSYDGILIADNTGKVLMVNSAWEHICGMKREKVLGQVTRDMVEKGFWSQSVVETTLKTGKTSTIMLEMTYGKNKGQKILGTGTPQFDNNGKLIKVIANIRNITELIDLKTQLEQSRELTKKYSSEIMEMRRLHQKFSDIIGVSSEMEATMEIVSRAAEVDATVLITGESGVGKEVIAKYLHKLSLRSEKPYIKINCAAIPVNLLESELFGYMPGAFTGADKHGKIGLFELASQGTLLLDEIGEMPFEIQAKLLRAIQSKEIFKIGAKEPIQINTRILAATNRDLQSMMQAGKFREDLYYRLNIINIHILPLRNRVSDIPPLIMHFFDKYNKKHNRNKTITMQAVDALIEYPWPGNIRELENLVERLVVLTKEKEIQVNDLPENYRITRIPDSLVSVSGIIPLKKAVAEVEKQLLIRAKQKYGSTRKMAKALGVDQSTIVRKYSSMDCNNIKTL
ncbi:MAG: sigma 54-interacting transcriptional regulator [Bacillota bacterium]